MAKKATRKSLQNEEPAKSENKSLNKGLHAAKTAKQDEFYTQYVDIEKEVESYLEFDPNTFRGKIIYCNCDDPFESNFFKYFASNFNKLGLKKLIATSYDGSPIAGQLWLFPEYNDGNSKRRKPKAMAVILDHVKDEDGDGAVNIEDVKLFLNRNEAARVALKGNDKYAGGDFRSPECLAFLKEADIVVTNPPFSLFRQYVPQLVSQSKKLLIIGNVQALTYKEIFPLVKENKLWMGVSIHSGDREFRVPDHYPLKAAGWRVDENGIKYIRVKGVRWYTNLDHGRRHQKLPLMSMEDNLRFSKHKEIKGKKAYDRYVNYDAIEVPFTDAIPNDYEGVMGVPITFLDKYNPEQFEILGTSDNGIVDEKFKTTPGLTQQFVDDYYRGGGTGAYKEGNPTAGFYENGIAKMAYKRIFVRHRRSKKREST
jgi:hypothetical protein